MNATRNSGIFYFNKKFAFYIKYIYICKIK